MAERPGEWSTTGPYYIADRRERDMVDFHPDDGIEVHEFRTQGERGLFWSEWLKAGGTLPDLREMQYARAD